MDELLYKSVFTPHGQGTVVFVFLDGTVCVKFDDVESGMILHRDQVFVRPTPKVQNQIPLASYQAA